MKIVVPDDFPLILSGTRAEPQLRALGDVAIYTERGANEEAELIRRVRDAAAVLSLRAYSRFTKRVLDECPSLRMISIWGKGTDNVDLDACRERGVTVTNTPGVNANSVAEHTLALMLAVTRQIPAMDRGVRAGQWPRALLVQLEARHSASSDSAPLAGASPRSRRRLECAFSRRRGAPKTVARRLSVRVM